MAPGSDRNEIHAWQVGMISRPGWECTKHWAFSSEFHAQRARLTETYGNFFDCIHALRVHDFTYQLSKAMGWKESECLEAAEDAFFHDFGKEHCTIKGFFLNPKLNDKRLQPKLTRLHQERAAEILAKYDLGQAERNRAQIEYVASHHHDPANDSPLKTTGDQLRRIVKVTDAFDIMTCSKEENPLRSYRKTVLTIPEAAVELWLGIKKGEFEPGMVQKMTSVLLEQPTPAI